MEMCGRNGYQIVSNVASLFLLNGGNLTVTEFYIDLW